LAFCLAKRIAQSFSLEPLECELTENHDGDCERTVADGNFVCFATLRRRCWLITNSELIRLISD